MAVKALRKLTRSPMPTDARDIVLGNIYTDTVSGIKGTAIIVYVHLTGCDQVCLSYKSGDDCKYITVDATRINELTPKPDARRGAGGPDGPPSRVPSTD